MRINKRNLALHSSESLVPVHYQSAAWPTPTFLWTVIRALSEEKVAHFRDTTLRQDPLHEFTRNVGQAVVAALGTEDHAGMIDS